MTLREAKRGSAGVLVAKREAAGDTQSVQEMTMWRKSFNFECPNSPKTHPNPPQTLPKLIQKPSKRPLGAHLGPLFKKKMIWNVQQAVKMRPKVAPRRSRASQTLPKWSSRPSQIRFLNDFCACFFLVVNLHRLFAVLWQNLFVFVRVDLQNSCAHAVFCWLPHVLACFEKGIKNHRKTLPKPAPNRRKIKEKSRKMKTNRWKKPRWVRKTKKCATNAKKCEKSANLSQFEAPEPKNLLSPTGWRTPTLYSVRSVIPVLHFENPFK